MWAGAIQPFLFAEKMGKKKPQRTHEPPGFLIVRHERGNALEEYPHEPLYGKTKEGSKKDAGGQKNVCRSK